VLRLWRESEPAAGLHDLHDITRFNEALDQSLGKAVASYTRRVDQSRRMFLAILSHDLRNPLNSISMSAQLASMRSQADETSSQALSQIETSVEAIARLIKDLLDFAAAGMGAGIPLAPGPVNLEQLVREVLGEIKAANPNRTLRFESHGDFACMCDSVRMRQVISNLLGNAIEHGADGSDVDLSLMSEEPEVILSVRNQGTPIPPELLPTLFDPLVRDMSADAQLRRRPGSIGLGLYIAHEIVTAHGGTIEVASSAHSGTVFTVRLPLRRLTNG
jgi:signal transduction histidine kinase